MQAVPTFQATLDAAAERRGGIAALEADLPQPFNAAQLRRLTDDRWLAAMTRSVFRAGFVWKIVDAKWPGFEAAFADFDTMACAMLSDEDIEVLHGDTRIIRNGPKIRTVRDNAVFIRQIKQDHGSFAAWIAQWPTHDIVGLWSELKARGSRLGGNSGPMTLRGMGKDTFLLTGDVTRALLHLGVIDRPAGGKRALARIQDAFNTWHEETSRPLCQLSRILAISAS